ncbi:restriction endonuclease [Arenimonas sp.]|uniref:restriction endonuclease n=1 Tax=Arenimonas sp. TaxID=1872635 RepID=UPI0025B88926|nr:restriction endonuclease [Arenimonas sp.]
MFGVSPWIAAVIATAVALLASTWWFGIHRRRLAENSAGIKALAGMKWRECAGLVLQAMAEKGYTELPSSRQPGDGGAEFLLLKENERCLLGYKHGTAYRLGEANVRDFANAVQLQGATTGMLVTLGSAEGFARDLARRYGVDLVDGRSLWPQVEPFAPAHLVEDIRHQAATGIRRGQQLGAVGSLVLGMMVFGVAQMGVEESPMPAPAGAPSAAPASTQASAEPATAAATPAAAPAPAAEPEFQDEASRRASDAMKELAAVAQLTDEERALRRRQAASRVADLKQANRAYWSTQSTLVVGLVREDGIDTGIVNEACAILVEYEELRYTRLQLEPPSDSTVPVRWKQCQ